MINSVVGKSILDFIKFVSGMILTLIAALLFVWGASMLHNQAMCKYQAKRLGFVYDYDYIAGCYFYVDGRWIQNTYVDYCRVRNGNQ